MQHLIQKFLFITTIDFTNSLFISTKVNFGQNLIRNYSSFTLVNNFIFKTTTGIL